MRAVDVRVVLTLAVAVASVPACAGNPAPREWREPAAVAQRSLRGGWIVIKAVAVSGARPTGRAVTEGELIAIDETAFHVLTTAGLQSVPRTMAHRITLVGYGTPVGALDVWAVAGGISTLSHGGYLLLTAPMWTIGGIVATRQEKAAGMLHDDDLARRFARFPQGLPPGLDPKSLGAPPLWRGGHAAVSAEEPRP
jgi:hypothetical protein